MFLSLKQQVSNTNNDVSTFESKLHELKEQTDMAISFHNNFIKSDENIKIIVNTTTTNAFKISTLENVTNIQSKEISTLEDDISNNASRIVAINNSFTATTDKLKIDLKNEIQNRDDADIMIQLNISEESKKRYHAIMAEEIRAINSENNLDNMIKTAQDTLKQSIEDESKLRNDSLSQLENSIKENSTNHSKSISSEQSRAINAETILDSKINNVETTLNESIENEATIRTDSFNQLENKINEESTNHSKTILSEELRAITAETTLDSKINNVETTLDSKMKNVESNLNQSITNETTNRSNADKMMTFISVGEAEGKLNLNQYPFCYGSGSHSKDGFGVGIPFPVKLVGIAISVCSKESATAYVQFTVEHFDIEGTKTICSNDLIFNMNNLGINKYLFNMNLSQLYEPGNICIRVSGCGNLSDIEAIYRISLFFQSQVELG
jgi:hypothetical protein